MYNTKPSKLIKNFESKAFSLIELMVAMGIMALLMALGFVGITALQRDTRDNDRNIVLGKISAEINKYERKNLKVPKKTEVVFDTTLKIANQSISTIPLNGHLSSTTSGTNSTRTRYYYTDVGTSSFQLCALLESGIVKNYGDVLCPATPQLWL